VSSISSHLERAISNKENKPINTQPFKDPSIPVIKGPGLGLPEFLKKRAAMPKVVDPMADAFNLRVAAGGNKKANPNVKVPVEETFILKQVGEDIRGKAPSEPS